MTRSDKVQFVEARLQFLINLIGKIEDESDCETPSCDLRVEKVAQDASVKAVAEEIIKGLDE